MANKDLYEYSLLKQDGTIEKLKPSPRKDLAEMYKILKCTTVEAIPRAYYDRKGYGQCMMWGDEEGRFVSTNIRNPHFHTLIDPDTKEIFDVVGDILMEKKA